MQRVVGCGIHSIRYRDVSCIILWDEWRVKGCSTSAIVAPQVAGGRKIRSVRTRVHKTIKKGGM